MFSIGFSSALTITDTIFVSSASNYTIHVDSIILDNVTITSTTIEFYNLTSVGSNLTNINSTYDARADFYGLDINLTVRNINTSTDLFTSLSGNQAYNATFSSGQIIRIMEGPNIPIVEESCSEIVSGLTIFISFIVIIVMIVVIGIILKIISSGGGRVSSPAGFGIEDLPKIVLTIVIVGVILLIGIIFITSLGGC